MKRSAEKISWFFRIIVNVILVAIFIATLIMQSYLSNLLPSQDAAKRWGNGISFSQVTAFIPENTSLSQTDIESIRENINLAEATNKGDEDAVNWTDSYGTEGIISVSREDQTVESAVTAISGNYFIFHPVELISGAYFSDDDVNDDLVILDKGLAWKLFRSTDVVGMEVEISNKAYVVSGVSACEEDFASTRAYGDQPRIYMSYSAYEKAVKSSGSGSANTSDVNVTDTDSRDTGVKSAEASEESGITMYMVLLPNPVKNYGLTELNKAVEAIVPDANCTVIENSVRYSPLKLLDLLKSFGERSMNKQGISYPYWENAARMVEDHLALLLLISILVLIFPVVTVVMILIKLWSNRKWTFKSVAVNLADKILRSIRNRKKI